MAIAKIADYPMPDIKGQIVNKVKWNIKKRGCNIINSRYADILY